MRILVHGASLDPGSRMALAAAGLALRGHQVTWAGGRLPAFDPAGPRPLPGCLASAPGGFAAARVASEIVLGEDAPRSPSRRRGG